MNLDSHLKQLRYTEFKESNPPWKKGGFSNLTMENGAVYDNSGKGAHGDG